MAHLTNSDDKSSCPKCIYKLLRNIPKCQHSKWFDVEQLCDVVNKCGAHSVSEDDICNVIRLCKRPGIICCNRYCKKTNYGVGDHMGMTPINTPFLWKSYCSIIDYYNGVESCTVALKVVQNE